MPFEEKIKEKADFIRIYGDKEEQDRLGIHGVAEISEYAGISHVLGHKLVNRGDTDINYNSDKFLETKNKVVDEALIKACEKGSPQALVTYFKRTGKIVEKREDTLTVVSTADRIRIARELRDGLRREWEDSRSCPVCHQSKALLNEVCDYTESKYGEDREVATLGLPTGLN